MVKWIRYIYRSVANNNKRGLYITNVAEAEGKQTLLDIYSWSTRLRNTSASR